MRVAWFVRCTIGRWLSTAASSVNSFDLILLDQRVLLGEFLLLLAEVVELAAVSLSVAMLSAVDVATLAGKLDDSDFLFAIPAFIVVSL